MTVKRTQPRRLAALALASVLAVTACGGGGDDDSDNDDRTEDDRTEDDEDDDEDDEDDDEDDEDPVVTEAPVETAVVEPTTTVAPETTTTTTTTTAPPDTVAVEAGLAEFCVAAEDMFLPGRALDFGDVNDPNTVQIVFEMLSARAQAPIDLAPTDDDAALFVETNRLLDIAFPGLEAGDFDVNGGAGIPNAQEVGTALIDYGAVLGETQTFLADRCGSDLSDLDDRARQIIDDIESGVLTAGGSDTAGDGLVFVPIESDDGSITVDVPADWNQIDGAPDGELNQIAAAPNLETFLASFIQPGMFLLAGPSATPDAWVDALDATVESSVESGCVAAEVLDYDDGVYTGEEQILDCGNTVTQTRVIGGRDEAGELFFLLAIIHPIDQPEIRDQIVQTFFI